MEFVQIMTSLAACADPQVALHADNYEVMRTWLDFLFGKVGFKEVNDTVLAWTLKLNPNAPVDLITDSIRKCGSALLIARGA